MERNIYYDVVIPCTEGLTTKQSARVGSGLDAAIIFGILEYLDGNPSLQDRALLEAEYTKKIDNIRKAFLR